MVSTGLLAFASMALAAAHGLQAHAPPPAPARVPQAPAPSFESDVKPLLAKKCSPCHAPGGKMYGKLPFDDPATVASHAPGIRKRLKGDDLKTLESWLAAAPK